MKSDEMLIVVSGVLVCLRPVRCRGSSENSIGAKQEAEQQQIKTVVLSNMPRIHIICRWCKTARAFSSSATAK